MTERWTRKLAEMAQSIGEMRIALTLLQHRVEKLERRRSFQTPRQHAAALRERRNYWDTTATGPAEWADSEYMAQETPKSTGVITMETDG